MDTKTILEHSLRILKASVKFARERPRECLEMIPEVIHETYEHHKERKQARQNLYQNTNFRLIQVIRSQDPRFPSSTMRLVTPATDPDVQRDLEAHDGGYYCISHYWGPENERIKWQDTNIVDSSGSPIHVEIRPSKCHKLRYLLEKHGGYWWIDLFCAHAKQGDPPIECMADIYRYCKKCFALLDCTHGTIDALSRYLPGPWHHADILPFYAKGNALADAYVSLIWSRPPSLYDLIAIMVWTVYPGKRLDFTEALTALLRSSWYSRVWTLQEAMLPCETVLMGEGTVSDSSVQYRHIAMIVEQIHRALVDAQRRVADTRYMAHPAYMAHPTCIHSQQQQLSFRKRLLGDHFIPAIDRAREVGKSIRLLKVFVGDAYYPLLLHTLSMTVRRCQHKRDYVYGVLGILDIEIQYTENLRLLWDRFMNKMRPLLPHDADLPIHYDLSRAHSLDSVYASFNPRKLLDMSDRWKFIAPFFLYPS